MGLKNYAPLDRGRKDRRLEAMVSREVDAAITLLAGQNGWTRSKAARILLAQGVAADKLLMGAAMQAAEESRERDAEAAVQTETAA